MAAYRLGVAPGSRPVCKPAMQLVYLLLTITVVSSLGGAVNVRGLVSASETVAERLSPVDVSACPTLRIAIVNQVLFHIEVLAGLLHIFDPVGQRTDVFIHPWTHGPGGVGAWDILQPHLSKFYFLNDTSKDLIKRGELRYDLVILVSPEYNIPQIQEMLGHMRPRIVVVYVHNIGKKEILEQLVNIAAHIGGTVKLVTLSTHTSDLLKTIVGQPVDSVLAVYPFNANRSCHEVPESELLGGCLSGFCVQGSLEGSRRGYGLLWAEVKARADTLAAGQAAALFHVKVLGKGNRSAVGVPDDLRHLVTVSPDVPFPVFYDKIHHSLAVVPALSSKIYLKNKFTSSILSSLITGTPLVANRWFLFAYQMLSNESVYLRDDTEREIDTMLRIVNMPVGEIKAVRHGLLDVRRRMNQQATAFYSALLLELCRTSSGQ